MEPIIQNSVTFDPERVRNSDKAHFKAKIVVFALLSLPVLKNYPKRSKIFKGERFKEISNSKDISNKWRDLNKITEEGHNQYGNSIDKILQTHLEHKKESNKQKSEKCSKKEKKLIKKMEPIIKK